MIDPPIEANIVEVNDGRFFPVLLHAIPAVGDLIDLYSFMDAKTGHPPIKYYEVVAVVHKLYDVPEDAEPGRRGSHFVTVFAKPSSSNFFEKSSS